MCVPSASLSASRRKRGEVCQRFLAKSVNLPTHTHTRRCCCVLRLIFDLIPRQPEALLDFCSQTEAPGHFDAMSCRHLVRAGYRRRKVHRCHRRRCNFRSSSVTALVYLYAATAAAALAEDPRLECGMSDAFHICWVFFYVREANQCRFRRDESCELLPEQTVNEISADAVVTGVLSESAGFFFDMKRSHRSLFPRWKRLLPLKVLFTYSCIYLMLSLIEEKIGRLPIFFLVLFTATRFQKPFEKKFGNNFCQKFWIHFFVKKFGNFLSNCQNIF